MPRICIAVALAVGLLGAASDGDWAQLARYQGANAHVGPRVAGKPRVVFYGDSITDRWPNVAGSFFPGKDYIDRGISGQTIPQMLVRFRQDVIDLHPRVVVILAGTNDIAGNTGPERSDQIEGYLQSLVELAQANHISVVLSSILPVYRYPWRRKLRPASEIASINAWVKRYAERQNVVYCDYYSALVDGRGGMRNGLSRDGVHPNARGYLVMTSIVENAIRQALYALSR